MLSKSQLLINNSIKNKLMKKQQDSWLNTAFAWTWSGRKIMDSSGRIQLTKTDQLTIDGLDQRKQPGVDVNAQVNESEVFTYELISVGHA